MNKPNESKAEQPERLVPQVYAAQVITERRLPHIAPEDFGNDRLAAVYLLGFASACPDIVFW